MKSKKMIFSILALLNVIFVPVFDVWGGLFPSDAEDKFFDVIEYIFEGEFSYWVVSFTLAIFIPSVFMFLFSFSNNVKAFKLSAGAGILFVAFTLVRFVSQYEIDYLFDFDDGNISIGTWIGFLLFIIAFIAVKNHKEKLVTTEPKSVNEIKDTNGSVSVNSVSLKRFCSQCGTELMTSSGFCGNCGHKIN